MCVSVTDCPPRFCRLNNLLAEYAALPADPQTGQATDRVEEQRILDGIRQELEDSVRDEIENELHLPPIDWTRWDAPTRNARQQRAEDAFQEFWERFLDSLHRRRAERQPPLVICARAFIHWWVVRVLRWRSLSPVQTLNALIVEYHAAGAPRETMEFWLFRAIERCCNRQLAGEQGGQDNLSEADRDLIRVAAQQLLGRFVAGQVWQNPVVDPPPTRTGEAYEAGSVQPLSTRRATVVYVTEASFRWQTEPLLCPGQTRGREEDRLDPDPPPPNPPTIPIPDPRIVIARTCEELAACDSPVALRHLCMLLFRPYYKSANAFCEDFTSPGFRVSNSQATESLTFWLERLTHGQRDLIQQSRSLGRDGFNEMVRNLVEYSAVYCNSPARGALQPELPDSSKVLADCWSLARSENRRYPSAWKYFTYREEKSDPPPRVVVHGDKDPPEILVLDLNEESRHAAPSA
jgi:hypothetical protein